MSLTKVDYLGIVAAACTTFSFVPQVWRTWRSRPKPAADLSGGMYGVLSFGIALWVAYGILIGSIPVIAANSVSFVFCFSLVWYKQKYG